MKIPSFIKQQTNITTQKMWHFYLSAALWVAAYTLFAYSVVIFMNQELQSEVWVGVFLAVGSAVAIVLDVPFGFMQKRIPSRILLGASTLGMILTVTIFLLAYHNIFLIFFAAILYGVSHDLYDVTMLSYIFNNTIPAQYGQNISQRSVAEAVGILFGLIFSGAVLYFGTLVAQITLVVILTITWIVILLMFDRDKANFDVFSKEKLPETLSHTAQELSSTTVKGLKTTAIQVIDVTQTGLETVKQSIEKGKIYLKPLQPGKNGIVTRVWDELVEGFLSIGTIFTGKKINIPLIWSVCVLLLFSFWDTFVITFEPLFLAKFLENSQYPRFITGGVIMTLFILPLFFLLIPFSKLSDKFGRHNFIILGLITSGISLFFFGQAESLWFMIAMGMTNSIGYAAVMPSVQAMFAEKYNEHLAISKDLPEIDTNSSAAPLKMMVNMGNVVGQALGGVLIYTFGFNVFFIIFGSILVITFITSLILYPILKKPPYIYGEDGQLI